MDTNPVACCPNISSTHGTVTAALVGMTTVTFIMLTLTAVGLIIELLAATTAPLGYQDENGFHLGRESVPVNKESDNGNPG